MKLLDPKNSGWRMHAWTLGTLLLVFLLAAHPELRLLVPLVDAVGLDILAAIFGLQVAGFVTFVLAPVRAWAWRAVTPLLRWTHRASSNVLPLVLARDYARFAVFHWIHPRLWLKLHTLFRVAR